MSRHYYLSVFPMEALIASELEPASFGTYMATGAKKGSAEQIIFIEIEGEFGNNFDWDFARERCVTKPDGEPKNSVYLSVYRTLEHIPLDQLESMFLTTRDGRTLALPKSGYQGIEKDDYYIYQELCPTHPVIVSRLDPGEFGRYMTQEDTRINIPRLVYTDLKKIDLDNPVQTGNIGSLYDRKIGHLKSCIADVTGENPKINKTLDRTHVESFAFQIISHGLYVSDGNEICMYKMLSTDEIKRVDYDWGRSALLI